ncbi:MAG: Ldh family oxidoreductase [Gammaproteobacteria bacterium]|nr:Ldh family oxidoreductase [Gammaproteobacteria bacterium]
MKSSLNELRQLAVDVLVNSKTSTSNATDVSDALVAAEACGIPSHGLSRLPFYADQAISGKVNGQAVPQVTQRAKSVVNVDAANGFAFPAIRRGIDAAINRTHSTGICGVGIQRSHHAGVLGHHVERAAEAGLMALGFSNSPSAIAPWGGSKGSFGTNPIAFACPRENEFPLIIDLSLSAVARGKVVQANKKGESIPLGWARNAKGKATTDPARALQGTMEPLGGAKGAALAFMVEILAAGLTGSNLAFEASSFFDAEGDPPGIGQFFILIDPAKFSASFNENVHALIEHVLSQPGTRLPGASRFDKMRQAQSDGIVIPDDLYHDLCNRAGK